MVRAAKKRRKRAAAEEAAPEENGQAEDGTLEAEGEVEYSVGHAIEAVRTALAPFESATRRKVVRAALTFLK